MKTFKTPLQKSPIFALLSLGGILIILGTIYLLFFKEHESFKLTHLFVVLFACLAVYRFYKEIIYVEFDDTMLYINHYFKGNIHSIHRKEIREIYLQKKTDLHVALLSGETYVFHLYVQNKQMLEDLVEAFNHNNKNS